ncbi:hypothetical protein M0R72_04940 [Candidatus Pacearchaeota archaeon]|jgi:hypothetical protein|nr:hypothetical protein [Candidatus Pacearchaeota archaeon]
MKSLENEQKLAMFISVENMLARKNIPVNDNLISRVQQAGDFFNDAIEGMYSVVEQNRPYKFPVDSLRKILEFSGYSFGEKAPQQKEELERAIVEFGGYVESFRELEDNPRRFFSDESRVKEIYGISKKMKDFYQRLVDEEDFREMQNSEN